MISIAKLKPSDVGRGVVYVPPHDARQDGVVSSWNERWIFVRYRGQESAQATDPADLQWLDPGRDFVDAAADLVAELQAEGVDIDASQWLKGEGET